MDGCQRTGGVGCSSHRNSQVIPESPKISFFHERSYEFFDGTFSFRSRNQPADTERPGITGGQYVLEGGHETETSTMLREGHENFIRQSAALIAESRHGSRTVRTFSCELQAHDFISFHAEEPCLRELISRMFCFFTSRRRGIHSSVTNGRIFI